MPLNLEEVRVKSILDVAQALGMELEKQGNDSYVWKEHDSLNISPNKNIFSWFSRDISGDAIKLVQTIRNVSFVQAASFIQNGNFESFEIIDKPKEPFKYTLGPYEQANFSEGRDCLKNERGLSDETIDFFIGQGVLAQAKRRTNVEMSTSLSGQYYYDPVLVFKTLDDNQNVIGTSMVGVDKSDVYDLPDTPVRRKQIGWNSDGQAGLNVAIGQPNRLLFFEAPIDLMSYYELHGEQLKDVRLVAMDGLKKATISRYVADLLADGQYSKVKKPKEISGFLDVLVKTTDYLKEHPDFITLAVDNDEKGLAFVEKLQADGLILQTDLPPLTPGQAKNDWNDELKARNNNSIAPEDNITDIVKPDQSEKQKNDWHIVVIPTKNIYGHSEKATAISMPWNDELNKGYSFLVSNKLVHDSKTSENVKLLSYKDNFTFELSKSEKQENGTYKVLDSKKLSGPELAASFKNISKKNKFEERVEKAKSQQIPESQEKRKNHSL